MWIWSRFVRSHLRSRLTERIVKSICFNFGEVDSVRITGRFHGELDPSHPMNRSIVDIGLAPRNARGKVEYAADFDILRPADPNKGNGTLLYDVNNRGNKVAVRMFNDTTSNNLLDKPEHAGDGFLFRLAFTVYPLFVVLVLDLDPFHLVLLGTILEATYLLFEVPTGVIADTISRRLSIVIGLIGSGSAFVVLGFAHSFAMAAFSQFLWGVFATFQSVHDPR